MHWKAKILTVICTNIHAQVTHMPYSGIEYFHHLRKFPYICSESVYTPTQRQRLFCFFSHRKLVLPILELHEENYAVCAIITSLCLGSFTHKHSARHNVHQDVYTSSIFLSFWLTSISLYEYTTIYLSTLLKLDI